MTNETRLAVLIGAVGIPIATFVVVELARLFCRRCPTPKAGSHGAPCESETARNPIQRIPLIAILRSGGVSFVVAVSVVKAADVYGLSMRGWTIIEMCAMIVVSVMLIVVAATVAWQHTLLRIRILAYLLIVSMLVLACIGGQWLAR